MKKLMTMLAAAVVAVGAFAEAFETGTAFSLASGDPGALSTAVIQELGVQDPVAAGSSGFWASFNDDVKVTAFGAEIAPARMQRFKDADFNHVNYLTVKTTLGNPVLRYAQKDAVPYSLNEVGAAQIYFQGNVKFTAFDEDPSTEYSNAKILLYVKDLSQFETPSAETNLYAKVGDEEYKVASGIDIDAWHTLTIKTMKIADGKLGFVVFLGDEATDVLSADTTITGLPTDLDPVAQYYASKNQLFPAGATGTTITEVGFDGQGSVDQIAFSTKTLIPDPSLQTITFGPNIATLILSNETTAAVSYLTTSPTNFQYDAANKGAYVYSYIAKPGYISQESWLALPEMGSQATIAVGDASEAKAAFVVDTTTNYYSDVAGAVSAADVSDTAGTVLLLDDANGFALANKNDGVTITVDLNGHSVVGVSEASAAILAEFGSVKVIDSASDGAVSAGDAEATVDTDDEDATIEVAGGTFNGETYATTITGGKFDVKSNTKDDGSCKLTAPAGKKWQKVESDQYWQLRDLADFTVKLENLGAANATAKVNGTAYTDVVTVKEDSNVVIVVTPDDDYEYATQPEGWTLNTEDGTITMTITKIDQNKTVYVPAATPVTPEGYTVSFEKGTGVADIVAKVAGLPIESGMKFASGITITFQLTADNIAFPIFKVGLTGGTGATVIPQTWTYTVEEKDVGWTFTAAAASAEDPQVDVGHIADAIAATASDAETAAAARAKVLAIAGSNVATAQAVSTWMSSNTITADALAESNYTKSSFELNMPELITDQSAVAVESQTFAATGSALTFKVEIAGVEITSNNIADFVKTTNDVANWDKVGTGIEVSVFGGVVTVDGGSNTAVFSKIVIPADAPAAE